MNSHAVVPKYPKIPVYLSTCLCVQWNTALQAVVLLASFSVPSLVSAADFLTLLSEAPLVLQVLWSASAACTIATGIDYKRRWHSQHPPWTLLDKTTTQTAYDANPAKTPSTAQNPRRPS